MPLRRGVLYGLDGLLHLVRARVALLILAHEQLELGLTETLGELVKRAAVRVAGARVEAALEGAADGVQISVARGGEDAVALAVVDRGLEPPPARESVLAGDDELGVAEPGDGVARAQLSQPLLGFVPEMLEVGAGGKLVRRAHDEPSFLSQGEALASCPASASCGQEVRLRRCVYQ